MDEREIFSPISGVADKYDDGSVTSSMLDAVLTPSTAGGSVGAARRGFARIRGDASTGAVGTERADHGRP